MSSGKRHLAIVNYVSEFNDNNIFHILLSEVLSLHKLDLNKLRSGTLLLIEDKISKRNPCQKWRYFVLSRIFGTVDYISKKNAKKLVDPKRIDTGNSYDCWRFIKYHANNNYINLVNTIRTAPCSDKPGYVLLNQRDADDRYLYDVKTRKPLEDFLSAKLNLLDIPFKSLNFATLSPEDQASICSLARVFISIHGAGTSNLIFTPEDCPLIEINFRKYWFCDEVCDRHFSGELKYDERCDGGLNFMPEFHKADFHNLCQLLDKRYIEVEAEKYDGYRSRNPISRKKVFVDGDRLSLIVAREYGAIS